MPDNKVYLTPEGLENLKKEREHLVKVKRDEVRQKIKEAREYGDITENAEYDAAKNEQAFVEGKIAELEQMIKNAVIIEEKGHKGAHPVHIGAKILVESKEGKETFVIVGPAEADPAIGRISHESPIGKGLLEHIVGDIVKIKVPAGEVEMKILKVD